MQLAVNGSLSSSPRTKHIKTRYYFIKDKIEEGEVEIQHCPTEKMWSDVLNKPKQGAGFRKDRSVLMNVPVDYDDQVEYAKTHPDLLPRSDENETLALSGVKQPRNASRSVLGDLGNLETGGVRANKKSLPYGNDFTWADAVRRGEKVS